MSASDLFGLTPHAVARTNDPETSWEAADSVKDITEQQYLILALFRQRGPMTDEDAYDHILGNSKFLLSESGYRTRRKELCDLGKLEFAGGYGETECGRKARIWRAKR